VQTSGVPWNREGAMVLLVPHRNIQFRILLYLRKLSIIGSLQDVRLIYTGLLERVCREEGDTLFMTDRKNWTLMNAPFQYQLPKIFYRRQCGTPTIRR